MIEVVAFQLVAIGNTQIWTVDCAVALAAAIALFVGRAEARRAQGVAFLAPLSRRVVVLVRGTGAGAGIREDGWGFAGETLGVGRAFARFASGVALKTPVLPSPCVVGLVVPLKSALAFSPNHLNPFSVVT